MHQGTKTAIPQDGESRGEICVTLKGEDGFGKDSVPSRRLGEEIRSRAEALTPGYFDFLGGAELRPDMI